ncbi:hypothetical protein GWN42_25945, partial [candidate division KSB1 bacterium]|nr:hypothetical protein [candidate division KSB1 bacterium]
IDGTFDGATVTFKTRRNGNEVDVYNGSSQLSVDGTGALDYAVGLYYGEEIKPVITGAGASTDLNINIYAKRD